MSISPTPCLAVAAAGAFWGGLLLGGWAGVTPAAAVMLLPVQVLALIGGYTVLHDASHRVAGRSRWVNELLLYLCGLMFMTDGLLFRRVHLLHHAHTHRPNDPDRFTSAHHWSARLARSATIALGYFAYAVRTMWREPAWRRRLFVALLLPVTIATTFALSGHLKVFAILWLAPLAVAETILGLLFSSLPHDHEHDRTRNLELPTVIGWLLGNGHLHLAHHRYPRVPWFRLPRFWKDVEDSFTPGQRPGSGALPRPG
jgi:fatty acid desaturase